MGEQRSLGARAWAGLKRGSDVAAWMCAVAALLFGAFTIGIHSVDVHGWIVGLVLVGYIAYGTVSTITITLEALRLRAGGENGN